MIGILWIIILFLKKRDQVKFVICSLNDYQWAREYIKNHDLDKKCRFCLAQAYNQMNLKVLADKILEDNLPVRLQVQLHKIIWGDILVK